MAQTAFHSKSDSSLAHIENNSVIFDLSSFSAAEHHWHRHALIAFEETSALLTRCCLFLSDRAREGGGRGRGGGRREGTEGRRNYRAECRFGTLDHTHARTHARTHAHTHTHTYTHTHTHWPTRHSTTSTEARRQRTPLSHAPLAETSGGHLAKRRMRSGGRFLGCQSCGFN
eukprot:1366532-Rhodomonas_salina.3